MKQTIKIAELATFIYAFLFFGALCVNMSYYAVFSINIVAYVEMSEIMLMFLTSPVLYVPVLFMIFYFIYQPSIAIDDISAHVPQISVIKRGFQKLNTMIILIFFSLLFSLRIVLDMKISESILCMLIMLFFVLPCRTVMFDNVITQAMKNLCRIGTEDFPRLWKQARNNIKEALFKDHEDIP
ncbi:MAG: hypothetical protein K2K30_07490, partial [Alistipes sp.]|nr:hypothetical protein [Alistipes sp.]